MVVKHGGSQASLGQAVQATGGVSSTGGHQGEEGGREGGREKHGRYQAGGCRPDQSVQPPSPLPPSLPPPSLEPRLAARRVFLR